MLLTTSAAITLGQAGLYALLGYLVVFFGLFLLMTVIILVGKFFIARTKGAPAPGPVVVPAAPVSAPVSAPGTAGQLKLHGVEPKTAAMIMAIVADKMGKPINELRFLSIREVTEE